MHKASNPKDLLKRKYNRYEDHNVDRRKSPSDPEQKELDRELDQALKDTFPASDPVQLTPPSYDR